MSKNNTNIVLYRNKRRNAGYTIQIEDATTGEPFAHIILNRDGMNKLLTSWQKMLDEDKEKVDAQAQPGRH